MICTVPKEIYLKVLDLCKKSRLVMVQDTTVLIDFDNDELNDHDVLILLEKLFQGVKNGK